MPEQVLQLEDLVQTIDSLLNTLLRTDTLPDGVPSDDEQTETVRAELAAFLEELQPFDIASVLDELEEPKQRAVLSIMPADEAAEVLAHLDHDHQYRLLDHLEEAVTRAIVAEMPSDSLVDLLGAVHPLQAREILNRLPKEDLRHIR